MRRLIFRLALALGRTVRELLDGLDSAELSEWLAYMQLEPLPDPWYQTGLMCAVMTRIWTKGRPHPQDFMPRVRSRRRQSVQEQLATFQRLAAAQNACVKPRS